MAREPLIPDGELPIVIASCIIARTTIEAELRNPGSPDPTWMSDEEWRDHVIRSSQIIKPLIAAGQAAFHEKAKRQTGAKRGHETQSEQARNRRDEIVRRVDCEMTKPGKLITKAYRTVAAELNKTRRRGVPKITAKRVGDIYREEKKRAENQA